MDTKQLMDIVEMRMKIDDGNPTSKSLLFEIYNALQELEEYKSKYNKSSIINKSEKQDFGKTT